MHTSCCHCYCQSLGHVTGDDENFLSAGKGKENLGVHHAADVYEAVKDSLIIHSTLKFSAQRFSPEVIPQSCFKHLEIAWINFHISCQLSSPSAETSRLFFHMAADLTSTPFSPEIPHTDFKTIISFLTFLSAALHLRQSVWISKLVRDIKIFV